MTGNAVRGIASSLKLWEQKVQLLWQAWARAYIRGLKAEPPLGVQGAEPPVGARAAKPPEADDILVMEHTFLHCPKLAVVTDLTEVTTTSVYIWHHTAAVLSVNN